MFFKFYLKYVNEYDLFVFIFYLRTICFHLNYFQLKNNTTISRQDPV